MPLISHKHFTAEKMQSEELGGICSPLPLSRAPSRCDSTEQCVEASVSVSEEEMCTARLVVIRPLVDCGDFSPGDSKNSAPASVLVD